MGRTSSERKKRQSRDCIPSGKGGKLNIDLYKGNEAATDSCLHSRKGSIKLDERNKTKRIKQSEHGSM